jgi:inorganic triphosphatase YgiF
LAYEGEQRVDTAILDQLETILRHVQEELSAWRTRALKAEADLKDHPGTARTSGSVRQDPEPRGRSSEVEQENKHLKQRVEAARVRVGELLSRLTFLEDQAREPGGNGVGRSGAAGGRAAGPGASEEGTA